MVTEQEAPALWQPPPLRRWILFVSIAVMLSLAIGGAGLYLARYQPLANGSSGWVGPDASHVSPAGDGYALSYQDRKTTMFAFTLRNQGPWGVTVTELVPGDPDTFQLLRITGGRLGKEPEQTIAQPGSSEAFKPFGLGPGHERWIFVLARFSNCDKFALQTSNIINEVEIRYRVLGFSKTTAVGLGVSLRVDSPPDSGCPERVHSAP
jgi:hypothetical protein